MQITLHRQKVEETLSKDWESQILPDIEDVAYLLIKKHYYELHKDEYENKKRFKGRGQLSPCAPYQIGSDIRNGRFRDTYQCHTPAETRNLACRIWVAAACASWVELIEFLVTTMLFAGVETGTSHPYKTAKSDVDIKKIFAFLKTHTAELERVINPAYELAKQKLADGYVDLENVGNLNEDLSVDINEDIEKHDELNPKLFNADNTLKEEVRQKVEEIVTAFTEDLAKEEIKIVIDDIILVGSNVSYNYTKDSDLDIHIIANTEGTSCPDNLYPKLYSAYRSLFNKKHDISFYGIPVEIYVETEDTKLASNGIYSVRNNTWIKEPVKEDIPDIDMEEFDAAFAEWEDRYNNTINEDESAIEQFIEDIYELRHQGIANGGEGDINNLVFKEFRNRGWLDNLKELQNQEESKELSLESLSEAADTTTIISDLIKDEEEAIAGYEQAIKDVKGLENEKEMSDRFEEISDDEKEHIKELKDLFTLDFDHEIAENIDNRLLFKLRSKLNSIAQTQVILQPNGIFTIHLVKEDEADYIINQLKRLPEIVEVHKTPGKFDFSQIPMPGRLPKRYYTINGKVKI